MSHYNKHDGRLKLHSKLKHQEYKNENSKDSDISLNTYIHKIFLMISDEIISENS